MIDYSFFRLKDSFLEAKKLGDSPVTTHFYNDFIQLSPKEAYLQITNVLGGISFEGDYTVDIVDCSNISLQDVTENIFITEFNDSLGQTQCSIEVINLNVDFYRETVFLRFTQTSSNAVYWSVPMNVTDYQIEQTTFYQYKCYDDFLGIPYTNAQVYQAIRLKSYFDIPIDKSETLDYYQISRQQTISARTLIKKFERYQIDYINFFCFERLNALLKSDIVYVDGVRVTDKPTLESNDREGQSNFFSTNFEVCKNYSDLLDYQYQIFTGINVLEYIPFGLFALGIGYINIPEISFDRNLVIGQSGSLKLFKEGTGLIKEWDISEINVTQDVLSTTTPFTMPVSEGYYYFNYTQGIATFFGIPVNAVEDTTTWYYRVRQADFNGLDFNNNDFFTP
jgi:hypothetical protein